MDTSFFERQQEAMARVAESQESYDSAEEAYQEAVAERADTYNEVKAEREQRMAALEEQQARQRAALSAEMDNDYAETLAEADRTVNSAVEAVNSAQDAWRETITAEVESKTVTRPQIEMAGLVLPQRRHTHRKAVA
ncbi:hypothetical protein [Corynebacterium sp. 212_CJEI]|uniref:hypothetical protein n=1 Tax=Corynebacterium sp. 212_CJEI TaxID=2715675 RepID=UPI0006654FCB|nr:hypothetical protein [Corynebacterium sp. 212_CJEI]